MSVAYTNDSLTQCLENAAEVSEDKPIVISKFITHAKEIEFDAVAQNGEVLNYGISEHIENAGVHSGDATLVLPAQKLYVGTVRAVKRIAQEIARALKISGPFNIQFLGKDNMVQVIECNLRASRTFPFVSKTLNANFITLATKVMLGLPCKAYNISLADYEYVAVKAPMFSFMRLRGADPTLGVEMASTGEVACFGIDVQEAFLQALLATNFKIPPITGDKVILVSIAEDPVRTTFLPALSSLVRKGYAFGGTPGTARFFTAALGGDVAFTVVEKPTNGVNGGTHDDGNDSVVAINAVDLIMQGGVSLLINIPEGTSRSDEITAGYLMRRACVDFNVPLITNLECALVFGDALDRNRTLPLRSLEDYIALIV